MKKASRAAHILFIAAILIACAPNRGRESHPEPSSRAVAAAAPDSCARAAARREAHAGICQ